jgi:hypothetical protein
MLNTAKRRSKNLLMSNIDYVVLIKKINNELKRAKKIQRLTHDYDLKAFSRKEIKNYKTSEKLFIMGSGSSINNLGNKEWEIIEKSDSIGVNFWLIHQFVPKYYMFEPGDDSDRLNTFYKLLELKSDSYSKVPFFLKDIESEKLDLSRVPYQLRSNIYVPVRFIIPCSKRSTFRNAMKIIKFFDLHNRNVLFFKRASISQAISFGLLMGYKEIILCGVDLNDTKYFYETEDYTDCGLPIPKNIETGNVHKSVDPTAYNSITIDAVIEEMNEHLLKPNKVSLYIGSKKSALYPALPCYFSE